MMTKAAGKNEWLNFGQRRLPLRSEVRKSQKTPENLITHIHKWREWFRFVHQIGYFLSAKLDKLISTSIYIRKCFSNSHNDVCFVCAGTQLCDAQLYLLESGYDGQYRTHRALCRTWNDTAPGYVCHVARLCVCLFGIGESRNFFFLFASSRLLSTYRMWMCELCPHLICSGCPGPVERIHHTQNGHTFEPHLCLFFFCVCYIWHDAKLSSTSHQHAYCSSFAIRTMNIGYIHEMVIDRVERN